MIEEIGISKRQLAKQMGRDKSTPTSWTKGRTEPDLASLAELLEISGRSADWLFGVNTAPAPAESEQAQTADPELMGKMRSVLLQMFEKWDRKELKPAERAKLLDFEKRLRKLESEKRD